MDNIVNITSLPLTPGQSDPRTWQKMKVNPNTRSKETIQPRGTIRSMGTHTIISNILVGKEEYNSMDIIAILNPKKRLHLQRKLASRSQKHQHHHLYTWNHPFLCTISCHKTTKIFKVLLYTWTSASLIQESIITDKYIRTLQQDEHEPTVWKTQGGSHTNTTTINLRYKLVEPSSFPLPSLNMFIYWTSLEINMGYWTMTISCWHNIYESS